MRKRILYVALALVAMATGFAAVALAAPAGESSHHQVAAHHKKSRCPTPYTAAEFRPFAHRVWRLSKWERGKPKDAVIAQMQKMRRCAAGPGNRHAMKRTWRHAKKAFEGEVQYQDSVSPPGIATLEAIAACESGGDPGAISSDGLYRGKYQFDYGTWESVGGSGDPAAAPEREQDERAAELYNRSGSSPWPVCG